MLKPALIELDSAVVELKHFTAEVVREFLPRYQWPEHHTHLFYNAVNCVFDDAMNQYLSWTPKLPDTLAQQVVFALGLTSTVDTLPPTLAEEFYGAMDDVISDQVFQCLITQISTVIGADRYNAWHVLPLGTSRVLTPGGIMIDLDRFKGQTGIVEVNLAEHWSHLPHANGQAVETGPMIPSRAVGNGPVVCNVPPSNPVVVKNLYERPSRTNAPIPTVNDDTLVADMMKDKEKVTFKRGKRTRRRYTTRVTEA